MFSSAFLDISLSAAAILLTTCSALATLCRCAIQLDSSYESHVAAPASFQTSGCCPYSDSRFVGILFQETRL